MGAEAVVDFDKAESGTYGCTQLWSKGVSVGLNCGREQALRQQE